MRYAKLIAFTCGVLLTVPVVDAQTSGKSDQSPRFSETLVVTATPKAGTATDYFLTFSGPVSVPGASLAAGTYLFRFPVQGATAIQVLKADRADVYAMFLTIPVEG